MTGESLHGDTLVAVPPDRQEQGVKTLCLLYGCHCNACCERIEKALRRVKGVRQVEVNLFKATATVEHDENCPPQRLLDAVERIGYMASLAEGPSCVLPKNGGSCG